MPSLCAVLGRNWSKLIESDDHVETRIVLVAPKWGKEKGDRGIHTNAATGNVSSNHDGCSSRFEFGQNPITFSLSFITVNSEGGVSITTEESDDLVCRFLCADKNESFVIFRVCKDLFEMMDQSGVFFVFGDDFHDLGDVVICRETFGTNVDLNEIFQIVVS